MIRVLRSLFGDDRGTAAIELAIIAPVLATMVVGVVDLSNGFSRKLALEQATQRAIEMVMQTTEESPVDVVIKDEVAAAAGIPTTNVTVTFRLECNEVAQPSTVDECKPAERQSRYLLVNATDRYKPMFSVSFPGLHADGTYHLSATSGLRTPSCNDC